MSIKGQAWYMDFVLAILIFSMCIILFLRFVPNMSNDETINEVYLDAKTLADSLMTKGHPHNWTNETVIRIGIADDIKINHSNLIEYYNMNKNDYESTKDLFRIRSDYAVFFTDAEDKSVNLSIVDVIGFPGVAQSNNGVDMSGVEYSDIVGLTRILTYNRTLVKMVIYTWI